MHVELYEALRRGASAHLTQFGARVGVPDLRDAMPASANRVNTSLAAQPLIEQLVCNQLADIPFGLARQLLSPMLVRSQRDAMDTGDAYLRDLLAQSDLAADNRAVDERYGLGLADHEGYLLA